MGAVCKPPEVKVFESKIVVLEFQVTSVGCIG